MTRHFGLTSRAASGVQPLPGSLTRYAILPRKSILPLAPRSPLERIDAAQALLNGLRVFFAGALIASAGAAFFIGTFLLFFVELR